MRVASALVAIVFAVIAAGTRASAQTSQTQCIPAQRFAAIAAGVVRGLHLRADEDIVPAFGATDQRVSMGQVALHALTPLITPSLVDVPIEIEVDGHASRTVVVSYRIVKYVRTAVAARDLLAGTVLTASDLTIARVPFAGRAANGADVLVGRALVGDASAGDPVYPQRTRVDEIVKPGSTVVLLVRDGNVSVVASVVARTGGGLGDTVSVYDAATRKALSGIVVGPNHVELDVTQE